MDTEEPKQPDILESDSIPTRLIEKPTTLDKILAFTPIPVLGERKAKKVAEYAVLKEGKIPKDAPFNIADIYVQSTMVGYRMPGYITLFAVGLYLWLR